MGFSVFWELFFIPAFLRIYLFWENAFHFCPTVKNAPSGLRRMDCGGRYGGGQAALFIRLSRGAWSDVVCIAGLTESHHLGSVPELSLVIPKDMGVKGTGRTTRQQYIVRKAQHRIRCFARTSFDIPDRFQYRRSAATICGQTANWKTLGLLVRQESNRCGTDRSVLIALLCRISVRA